MGRSAEVVDLATGEVVEGCRTCAEYLDQIAGLERDLRAWRARYADAVRDREREAREHPVYPHMEAIFAYWRNATGHTRSKYTAERFWLALPFLEKYGFERVLAAIDGAGFDPYITTRKNGTKKHHNGWELIFRSEDKFEEFERRVPPEVLLLERSPIAEFVDDCVARSKRGQSADKQGRRKEKAPRV